MTKRTRNITMAALVALAIGSVELVASAGFARHPEASDWNGQSRAVLAAGRIVARDLGTLALARAKDLAGAILLRTMRQTSHVYRLALGASGAGRVSSSVATVRAVRAGGVTGNAAVLRVIEASDPGSKSDARGHQPCPPCPTRNARRKV